MTTYIYARVSTTDQNVQAQLSELMSKHSSDYQVTESFSGTTTDRPKFQKLLGDMESGDTLIVREVSRVGRDTKQVLEVADTLRKRGISLVIDNLGVDVTTPSGKMVLSVLASVATMERELMLERQRIGINDAKAKGIYKGRKALDPKLVSVAKDLIAKGMTKAATAKQMNIGVSTLYKYLSEAA
jgi:DNA invertase Pin-like site-specific DNA recombinase